MERLLSPHMKEFGLQSDASERSPERLLSGVRANVLPQVAERGEVLGAAFRFAVEGFARVESLVSFEPAHKHTGGKRRGTLSHGPPFCFC